MLKRFFIIILVICIGISYLSAEEIGVISFIKGKVVKIEGEKEALLKVGDIINSEDKIISDFTGRAEIKLLKGGIVRIDKKTDIDFKGTSENLKLLMDAGKIYNRVKRLTRTETFEVQTPTATAGIRGTIFIVEQKNKKMRVKVKKGKVEVKGDFGKKLVKKNRELIIAENGKIEKFAKIKQDAEFENFLNSDEDNQNKKLPDINKIEKEIKQNYDDIKNIQDLEKELMNKLNIRGNTIFVFLQGLRKGIQLAREIQIKTQSVNAITNDLFKQIKKAPKTREVLKLMQKLKKQQALINRIINKNKNLEKDIERTIRFIEEIKQDEKRLFSRLIPKFRDALEKLKDNKSKLALIAMDINLADIRKNINDAKDSLNTNPNISLTKINNADDKYNNISSDITNITKSIREVNFIRKNIFRSLEIINKRIRLVKNNIKIKIDFSALLDYSKEINIKLERETEKVSSSLNLDKNKVEEYAKALLYTLSKYKYSSMPVEIKQIKEDANALIAR